MTAQVELVELSKRLVKYNEELNKSYLENTKIMNELIATVNGLIVQQNDTTMITITKKKPLTPQERNARYLKKKKEKQVCSIVLPEEVVESTDDSIEL